jgi:hypothetical protein
MNYRTPIAESWNHAPIAPTETGDEVASMLERLKGESTSLDTYFSELESELRRVHLKRKVVGKKLGALSALVKDVEALHAEPMPAASTAASTAALAAAQAEIAESATRFGPAPRSSRRKPLLIAVAVAVVVCAIALIALEKTGQLSSCNGCAPLKLLGLN